jgi:hypothetical protein
MSLIRRQPSLQRLNVCKSVQNRRTQAIIQNYVKKLSPLHLVVQHACGLVARQMNAVS